MRRSLLPTALAIALALGSTEAFAGNQEAVFLGNEAALSGGAVVAWVGDGGAAWYNPAGLATIERTSVDLSASAFMLRYYHLPDAARTQLPGGTQAEDASFTELVSVPSALTVVRRLADGVSGALAVYVPFREELLVKASHHSDASVPYTYQWSLAASRSTARYYAGPALGFRIAPALSMGLSTFLTYEGQDTTRDFRSSLSAPTAADVRQAVFSMDRRVQSKRFGTAWVLGWRWDPSASWSAGLVLRGPLLHVGGFTDVDLGASESRIHGAAPPRVVSSFQQLSGDDEVLDVMEPARVTLGLARQVGPGRVALEGGWQTAATGGGRVRQPVWHLRAGAAFAVSEQLTLGGGMFTDLSPDPPPDTLGATQVDFFGGSFGVQFRSPYDVQLPDEQTVGLVFSTTVAARYAVGIGEIGSLTFNPLAAPRDQIADVTIHELSLHVGSALDF